MKTRIACLAGFLAALSLLWAQLPFPQEERSPRLKRSQIEAMLKDDYEKSLKDAARLLELAENLKEEMEKNERYVLSVKALRNTEEIEKLARRIRSRMRRY